MHNIRNSALPDTIWRFVKLFTIQLLCMFYFVEVPIANAQSIEQLWFEYRPTYKFEKDWKLSMRASYRTNFAEPRWRTFETRFMPEKKVNKYIDVLAAFQFIATEQLEEFTTVELRPAIGGRVHFTPDKRIETFFFPRIEYRFILNQEDEDWDGSLRIRTRVGAQMPFNKKTMHEENTWYGIVDAEAFFIEDKDIEEAFTNRLWLRFWLGYQTKPGTRFEIVYNLQESKKTATTNEVSWEGFLRFVFRHNLN